MIWGWLVSFVGWVLDILAAFEPFILVLSFVTIAALFPIRRARAIGGLALSYASCVLAARIWLTCFLYMLTAMSKIWLISAIGSGGLGVIPIVLVCAALYGHWSDVLTAIADIAVVLLIRFAGIRFMMNAAKFSPPPNLSPASTPADKPEVKLIRDVLDPETPEGEGE